MIAVISTGGKQYVVKEGDVLKVESLKAEPGATVAFDALLMSEQDGSKLELGAPTLHAQVAGEIIEHGRGVKVSVVKYKAKVRYKKRVGHRQNFTRVKITKIA